MSKTPIILKDLVPYKGIIAVEWALDYIMLYGSANNESQKAWVIEQVARILNGPSFKLAKPRGMLNTK